MKINYFYHENQRAIQRATKIKKFISTNQEKGRKGKRIVSQQGQFKKAKIVADTDTDTGKVVSVIS